MNSIKLWINHQEVEAGPSQTIMEVADQTGVHIPRLCYHPLLKPSGACRLCAVEIDGTRGLPAACSTPVAQGIRVETQTPKVLDFRREMLRLILQDHPRECLGCPRNGTCELQRLVETVGIDFPYSPPAGERPPVQPAGPYFERDMSLCVRCGRCVRVCHEVRGAKAIVFREVKGRQEVGAPLGRSLDEAGCQFCGACVDVCPVGALREKNDVGAGGARAHLLDACEGLTRIVLDLYRKERPQQRKTSVCPICSAGCRMSFESSESGEIVQVRPGRNGSGKDDQACVQGRFLLKEYLQSNERPIKPLVLEDGRYREADWEAVLDLLAKKFENYGAWETAVITDAGLTTEELFLLQKFARTALRTNLVGCIAPSGHAAAEESLSKRADPAAIRGSFHELSRAGCVLALGVNPPASHPIAGTLLRQAVLDGTKLIAANPLSVGITHYADVNLHYMPGTEPVLIAGLIRLLLDENLEAPAFVAANALYINTLKGGLAPYHLEAVARITGVHPETLLEAAHLMGGSKKPLSILYGPGLLESADVCESMEAMATLLHLTGSVSKAGGGMIPLYGNGNLYGASDLSMTSVSFSLPAGSSGECGCAPGDIGQMLSSSQVKALYVASGSLDGALFDSLRPYLNKLELVVLHDTVLPPSIKEQAGSPADVILPMASALEKGGTFSDADRKAVKITPVTQPPGEARSVLWVLRELARRMEIQDFASEDDEVLRSEIWKQIAASTTLVRRTQKAPTGCSCCGCGTPVKAKPATDSREDIPEWKPMPLESAGDFQNKDLPLRALLKEDLEPYFNGPLLAEEVRAVLNLDADIQMNPSDVFPMGMAPGETVRIVTAAGEREGRLGLNPLLPPKVVAVSRAVFPTSATETAVKGKIVAARVERAR